MTQLASEVILEHYLVLGIRPGMSDTDVRDAYKKKVLEHHPDKRADGDDAMFKRVQKAYEVVRDGSARKMYDSEYGSLKAQQTKRQNRASAITKKHNPHYPSNVSLKSPLQHALPDGTMCTFEISPEAFRCSLRHGDIVMTTDGVSGVIVGVGNDGIYWSESGDTYASFFGCVDFGMIQYKKIGNIGSNAQAHRARCDYLAKKQREDLEKFKAKQQAKKKKEEEAEAQRKREEVTARYLRFRTFLEKDEQRTRDEFIRKVNDYWDEVFRCMTEQLEALASAAEAPGSPRTSMPYTPLASSLSFTFTSSSSHNGTPNLAATTRLPVSEQSWFDARPEPLHRQNTATTMRRYVDSTPSSPRTLRSGGCNNPSTPRRGTPQRTMPPLRHVASFSGGSCAPSPKVRSANPSSGASSPRGCGTPLNFGRTKTAGSSLSSGLGTPRSRVPPPSSGPSTPRCTTPVRNSATTRTMPNSLQFHTPKRAEARPMTPRGSRSSTPTRAGSRSGSVLKPSDVSNGRSPAVRLATSNVSTSSDVSDPPAAATSSSTPIRRPIRTALTPRGSVGHKPSPVPSLDKETKLMDARMSRRKIYAAEFE
eukprot:PhM_4_TR15206/c0_g1_i1/m.52468